MFQEDKKEKIKKQYVIYDLFKCSLMVLDGSTLSDDKAKALGNARFSSPQIARKAAQYSHLSILNRSLVTAVTKLRRD
jgi:hypothetical protein